MDTQFYKIPGFNDRYLIDKYGHVMSLKCNKKRLLKPRINTSGYYQVTLYVGCDNKTIEIHKLMAITFLGHIPNGNKMVVDHINSNRLDNVLTNLRIISNRENTSNKKQFHSSKFVGVSFDKSRNKWSSQIYHNGKNLKLGRFNSEIEASLAYQNYKNENNI